MVVNRITLLIKQKYFKKYMKNIFKIGYELVVCFDTFRNYKVKLTTSYNSENVINMITGKQKIIKNEFSYFHWKNY